MDRHRFADRVFHFFALTLHIWVALDDVSKPGVIMENNSALERVYQIGVGHIASIQLYSHNHEWTLPYGRG